MQHFPFSASTEMDTPQCTPNVNDTKGYMTLGNLNWTICNPQNPFLQNEFPLYALYVRVFKQRNVARILHRICPPSAICH